MNRYTVWVGGTEVNDHLLNKREADALANTYKHQGHDDVQIQEIEPKIVSMSIDHAATCYPDYFGGHQYSFCLYADGNTTYQDLKEGMLDWQNTDHLNYNLFKTDYEWGLYQDAVELLFHDAEEAGTMNDIFDPRLDIPVTEEEQEEYSCYAWFIIEPEFEDIEES